MPSNNQQPSPAAVAQVSAEQKRLAAARPRTRRLLQAQELRELLYAQLQQFSPGPIDITQAGSLADQLGRPALGTRAQLQHAATTHALVDTLLTEVLDWQRLALTLAQKIDEMMTAVPHVAPEHAGKTWALGMAIGDVMGRANQEALPFTAEEYHRLADTWAFHPGPLSAAQMQRFTERSRQAADHLRFPYDFTPGNLPEPHTPPATPSDNLPEGSAPTPLTTTGKLPELPAQQDLKAVTQELGS